MENHRNDPRSGTYDKAKGTVKDAAGTIKQKAGELTGDRDLQARGIFQRGEGKLDKAKGAVKNAAEDAKQAVKGGVDALKGRDRDTH